MNDLNLLATLMVASFSLQLWLSKKIVEISEDIAAIKQSHNHHSQAISDLVTRVEDHEHRLIKIETKLGELHESVNP